MSIGEKIRALRKKYDMSMEKLGELVGVSKVTIFKWENDQVKNIDRDNLEKLANALHVTPAYLLGYISSETSVSFNVSMQDLEKRLQPSFEKAMSTEPHQLVSDGLIEYATNNKHESEERMLLMLYRMLTKEGKADIVRRIQEILEKGGGKDDN